MQAVVPKYEPRVKQYFGTAKQTFRSLARFYCSENILVSNDIDNVISVEGRGFIRFEEKAPKSMCAFPTLNVEAGPYDRWIAPHLAFAVTEAWENKRSKADSNVIVFTMTLEDEEWKDIAPQFQKLCKALVECLLKGTS
jgi:hypothetical protein